MTASWVLGGLVELPGGSESGRRVLILDGTHEAGAVCQGFRNLGWRTFRSSAPLVHTDGLDLIVSYGYRHIIPDEILQAATARIINLHISYLPFNRGAHPGFWCFYDGTPCGVTIHEVDEGIDTGPVLAQRVVEIDPWTTTFDGAYWQLRSNVESLLWDILPTLSGAFAAGQEQLGTGSSHRASELPASFKGWEALVGPEIVRLHEQRDAEAVRAQNLINRIEKVRSSNNVNWMDILRLAFKSAPDQAKQILTRINQDDGEIASLLDELAREPGQEDAAF